MRVDMGRRVGGLVGVRIKEVELFSGSGNYRVLCSWKLGELVVGWSILSREMLF